jgi:hypothetical protein
MPVVPLNYTTNTAGTSNGAALRVETGYITGISVSADDLTTQPTITHVIVAMTRGTLYSADQLFLFVDANLLSGEGSSWNGRLAIPPDCWITLFATANVAVPVRVMIHTEV